MKRHESVSKKAEQMLNRICKKILKEPRQLVMDWVLITRKGSEGPDDFNGPTWKIPNCGTAACIAGWGLALSKNKTPSKLKDRYSTDNFFEPAREAMGLTDGQAHDLFFENNWPNGWGDDYVCAEDRGRHKRKAKIAVKRIKHFIETGE